MNISHQQLCFAVIFLGATAILTGVVNFMQNDRLTDLECRLARMETLATSAKPLKRCEGEEQAEAPRPLPESANDGE